MFADTIQRVTGVEHEPDDYHGTVPLAVPAAERFDELADAATLTHQV